MPPPPKLTNYLMTVRNLKSKKQQSQVKCKCNLSI